MIKQNYDKKDCIVFDGYTRKRYPCSSGKNDIRTVYRASIGNELFDKNGS